LSFPGFARLVLDDDERAMLKWFAATDDPALAYLADLKALLLFEEHAATRLLFSRCVDRSVFGGPDRLADDRYRSFAEDVARSAKKDLEVLYFDGGIVNNWLAALIYTYRSSDPATRAAWREHLKTREAASARDWANKLSAIQEFPEIFAVDVRSGRPHASWLHWLNQFLERAGLAAAFVRAADKAYPDLGAAFREFVAEPARKPLSDTRRSQLEELSAAFADRTEAISEEVNRSVDPAVRSAASQWTSHPFVARVSDAKSRLEAAGPFLMPAEEKDKDLVLFLRKARGEREEEIAVDNAIANAVKLRVEATCATLK
jgi:hypothetical protein